MMKTLALTIACTLSVMLSSAQVTSFSIDETKVNQPLARQLDSIYQLDQSVRIAYMQALKDSTSAAVADSLLTVMRQTDAQNLIKVETIIKQHGWIGPQKVGISAAQGLFLVIQHADLKTQERFLPMIREAEKKGEILSSNLAILEDRIDMRNGKKQTYGSQGITDAKTGKKYIYPIIDVDNLDQRRKAMGMPPMKDYVPDWNLEKYKQELPEIERIVKTQVIK